MGAVGGSLTGLLYSFVFLYEATEGRAIKAGYPHGTLHEVRNELRTERALRRAAAGEFRRDATLDLDATATRLDKLGRRRGPISAVLGHQRAFGRAHADGAAGRAVERLPFRPVPALSWSTKAP